MADSNKPHIRLHADGRTETTGLSRKSFATRDSFENFWAKLGWGTGNIGDASHYGFHPITRNRLQLEWVYRGSWIAGKAVDAIPEDMTREGVDYRTDEPPDKIQDYNKSGQRLRLWKQVQQALKWGRLYGGALAFIMIDGQASDTPLKVDSIKQGQFKGLLPMDRWLVQPSLMDLVDEMGPEYGQPKFYDTVVDINGGIPRLRMHHSRIIRFTGVELPYWQRITENLWELSVLERLWDRLLAFDTVSTGAAQLVFKAHLRTYAIKDLRSVIAMGGPALDGLTKQINWIRAMQTTEGITLMDAEDKFEVHPYSFSGLDSVMLQFGQQLSGALDIPLVRLFGQSPAGLNATGESDMAIYRSGIKQRQESDLRAGVERVDAVHYRSCFGKAPPSGRELEFKPIDQPTEEELADIIERRTQAIVGAYTAEITDLPTAMRGLRNLARETGAFSEITDEMIKKAETQLKEAEANAPTPEELGLLEGQVRGGAEAGVSLNPDRAKTAAGLRALAGPKRVPEIRSAGVGGGKTQ